MIHFAKKIVFLRTMNPFAQLHRSTRCLWKLILAVSIASLLVMLGASFTGALNGWDALSDYSVGYVLYQLLRSIVIWSWMLFVLYFGLRVLNFSNKIIDYANEAILPFYVLHYPVIVVIAFLTFTWGLALASSIWS
jgi:hypothetical protein